MGVREHCVEEDIWV